jgi:hypothetical protein
VQQRNSPFCPKVTEEHLRSRKDRPSDSELIVAGLTQRWELAADGAPSGIGISCLKRSSKLITAITSFTATAWSPCFFHTRRGAPRSGAAHSGWIWASFFSRRFNIYSDAWLVTHDGSTMMRGLVMDFRNDPKVYGITDQYMFGPAIMVNPVTQEGSQSRRVYLPAGTNWFDFWTGKSLSGGQTIEAAAPIHTLPLFVRAGSIIPMGPIVESAMESDDWIALRVYRGHDGTFSLYEDAGDNYDYEKGGYATIPLSWDDARGVLSIGARRGEFPGLVKNLTFRIVWVRERVGVGLEPVAKADVQVAYDGHAVEVRTPR